MPSERPWIALALTFLLPVWTSACADDAAGPASTQPDAGPCDIVPEEPIAPPPIHTPRWAFEPWISKDISNGPDTYEFVQGCIDRDIPVGVVVIDSPWETHYNTFIPNEARYPDFPRMIDDMHARNVRVVLWVTQMINNWYLDAEPGGDAFPGPSPNLQDALDCGYLVNDGAMYVWWKGRGGGIDFFDPKARAWWHRQQDALLAMGINGWKLDFAESYIRTDPVQTAQGPVSHQEYSEAYYRDFYAYGASRNGTQEFLTMVRPWDESYDFEGRFFARPEHAPVAWVGDQRRDWVGLADALDEILRSADAGYVVLGSDIGGYLDFDDKDPLGDKIPFDLQVFLRWTAIGAMSPFMQLHGRANLTPWSLPGCEGPCADEATATYRYWAKLHHQLVPFFYSLAQEAYAHGGTIVRPVATPDRWAGDYRYQLGDAWLVAPVLDATGRRDVALPDGARWLDWWSTASPAANGGTILTDYDATDSARIPIFLREGAIVPMTVDDDTTGMGTASSAGHLTVLIFPPASGKSSFVLHELDDTTTDITVTGSITGAVVTLSRMVQPTILRIQVDSPPSSIMLGASPLGKVSTRTEMDAVDAAWWWDESAGAVWAKVGTSAQAVSISLAR